jgi:hypothetical protein
VQAINKTAARGWWMLKVFLSALMLVGFAVRIPVDGVTVGTLTCTPNINATGCALPLTGDDNGNATVALQYKETGSMTWLDAYSENWLIDRRGGIYALEFRSSVVGLDETKTYDYQATVSDADGVTGTNPAQDLANAMVRSTPTVAAGTCPATTTAEVSDCITMGSLGTITLAAGAYTKFTLTNGGASIGAIRKIACAVGAEISSPTVSDTQAILISSNNWWIDGCTFPDNYFSTIRTTGTRSGIYLTNNIAPNISSGCAILPQSPHLGDSFFGMDGTTSNAYVLNNTIGSVGLLTVACKYSATPNANPGNGIGFPVTFSNIVIKGNNISGGFKDGIGIANTSLGTNYDIHANTVSQSLDDQIDGKGMSKNARFWENVIIPGLQDSAGTKWGIVGLAITTNVTGARFDGPLFAFRNYVKALVSSANGGQLYKAGGVPTLFVHNTGDGTDKGTTSGTGRWGGVIDNSDTGCPIAGSTFTSRNNITITGAEVNSGWCTGSTFDYELLRTTGTGNFVRLWSSPPTPGTFSSTLYSDFISCALGPPVKPCQLQNYGSNADPGLIWTGSTLTITTASDAYANGVDIPNFNGPNTAWPFSGANPDIGAYVVNSASLTSISPDFGTQGTTVPVALTGVGFEGSDMGASTVVNVSGTGITQASLTVVSDISITVDLIIAAGATASARDVTVTTDEVTTNAQPFTVAESSPFPTLSSIAPSTGRVGTTVPVTLTGTDFDAGGGTITEACFGIAFTNIVVVGATSITALAVIDSDALTVPCDVAVTTNDGTSNTQPFTPDPSGLAPAGRLTGRGGR